MRVTKFKIAGYPMLASIDGVTHLRAGLVPTTPQKACELMDKATKQFRDTEVHIIVDDHDIGVAASCTLLYQASRPLITITIALR